MKSKFLTVSLLAAAMLAGLGTRPAMAQTPTPPVDQAQQAVHAVSTPGIDTQQYQASQRIDEGVRSGRLTQREAHKLQRREREIARHESFFKSDGVVTLHERRQLRNELEALRDEVEHMMSSDRQDRG